MRFLKGSNRFLAAGLFLFCFLGLSTDARPGADPLHPVAGNVYQFLQWEFSVPVKLKGMMNECHKAFIEVMVYDAQGGEIAEGREMIDVMANGPNIEKVLVMQVTPLPQKNPFLATRYTVNMMFDNQRTPSFDNNEIRYRAKEGSELVYHIDQPMPAMDAANEGMAGGANALQ